MRSLPAFLAVAAAVTLTPGPPIVDRCRELLRRRLTRRLEQLTGAVLVAFGVRLATATR